MKMDLSIYWLNLLIILILLHLTVNYMVLGRVVSLPLGLFLIILIILLNMLLLQ